MTLIFTGGEHPSQKDTQEFLKKIQATTSSKPFIIAADSGLTFCLECNFKPDVICGDFDSIYEIKKIREEDKTLGLQKISLELQKKYPKTIIHQWPLDKDYTDTQIALHEATTHNSNNIILIGGDGGRPDHFFANSNLFKNTKTPQYWLCKDQYVKMLSQTEKYDITEESSFSIFPNTNHMQCPLKKYSIKSTNLQWPVDKIHWDTNGYSLSNRLVKDARKATLFIKKGYFLFFGSYEGIPITSQFTTEKY